MEIDRKLWHVVNADTDIIFRKDTNGLWEEMMRLARAVTARAAPLERFLPAVH